MKLATDTSAQFKAINDRHIPRSDKFFRMFAGATTHLVGFRKTSFTLETKIDHRVTEEDAPGLLWNIAQSWRKQPELESCINCMVILRRSPGPTGFAISRKVGPQDSGNGRKPDQQEVAALVREIKRTSQLPAPLIGSYLLWFMPEEFMSRLPDQTTELDGN